MKNRVVIRRAKEKPVESWVVKKAKDDYGVLSIKLGHRFDRSWPDRLFWIPGGRPLVIEFKKPGGKASDNQIEKRNLLVALGYDVIITDDRDFAISAIAKAVEAARGPAKRRKVSP